MITYLSCVWARVQSSTLFYNLGGSVSTSRNLYDQLSPGDLSFLLKCHQDGIFTTRVKLHTCKLTYFLLFLPSIDWHPNNFLLAAGSTDFKARLVSCAIPSQIISFLVVFKCGPLSFRVFSGHIKEVDGKPPKETQWGEKPSFGTCLSEFSNGRGKYFLLILFTMMYTGIQV